MVLPARLPSNITTAQGRGPTHLDIDASFQLLIEDHGESAQVTATLRGYKVSQYLLLELPEGTDAPLYPGARCVARYSPGTGELGFVTRIQFVYESPATLIFVGYPEILQEYAQRKEERLRVSVRGALVVGDQRLPGTVRDLSRGGCAFVVKSPARDFSVGDRVELMIQLPGQTQFTKVDGTVRRTKAASRSQHDTRWIGIQFRFDEETAHVREHLERLFERQNSSE